MKRLRLHRQHPELPRLFVRESGSDDQPKSGVHQLLRCGSDDFWLLLLDDALMMSDDLEVDMEYLMGFGELDKERTRVGLVLELEESREG
ncbi:hypothetical protein M8C21_026414, partial [Ambrosia artemisiifolia]